MATGNMHKNLVKFGQVVFELCERTNGQTNRHPHHNTSHPPGGKVKIVLGAAVLH